ncbi:hypothetical protein BDY21DRAFT_338092 [Lineolata rhizophorae]|uniref:C2H2-type domain-containing protein n=1 Tax=Lineolata rhizophorae TaxID=578093 RepID=A0A6A6P6K9_9PEZI|nr:hypothetical protein BDY21DRAFT_338092 [Lineolata rhizophorae]
MENNQDAPRKSPAPPGHHPPTPSATARTTSGEFVCSICGDSFKRLEHMSRHKLSHSDDKPYCCPTCSKSFTRK